jgi:hypothetical protein
MRHLILGAALAALAHGAALATQEEDYAVWPLLPVVFESTGGGGVMIGEYEPVVIEDRCLTRFTATTPDGAVYRNIVLFRAVPAQGGILCTDGAWRALDGDAQGTTPLRVFIRDGVRRRAP